MERSKTKKEKCICIFCRPKKGIISGYFGPPKKESKRLPDKKGRNRTF